MSSNKRILFFLVPLIWLAACKPPAKSFIYQKSVNFNFFKNMPGFLGNKNIRIDSVKVYRAVLTEQLVERDNVSEYKLINELSTQPTVELADTKNFNHLFFMQLYTTPASDDLCVFLSAGYNPDGICTSIGPAYMGNVRINQIDVKRELKVKNFKSFYQLFDKHKKDMNIIAYEDFPETDDRESTIRIKQFILQEPNKIGGIKPVLFTTEKIFNDSNTLAFNYFETLLK